MKWTCKKCGEVIETEPVYDMDGYFYGDKTSAEIEQIVKLEHQEKIIEYLNGCR